MMQPNDYTTEAFKKIILKRLKDSTDGESLSMLAKKLGYTSASILSMILKNKRSPSASIILKAGQVLDLTLEEFFSLYGNLRHQETTLCLLDSPFSGAERKEFYAFLNSAPYQSLFKQNRSSERFERFQKEISSQVHSPHIVFQDNLNFPQTAVLPLSSSKRDELKLEINPFMSYLVKKYTAYQDEDPNLVEIGWLLKRPSSSRLHDVNTRTFNEANPL